MRDTVNDDLLSEALIVLLHCNRMQLSVQDEKTIIEIAQKVVLPKNNSVPDLIDKQWQLRKYKK